VKEILVRSLCCPVCKGALSFRKSGPINAELEGVLVCQPCSAEYNIQNGIPRLYVGDDETIERSDQSKHSDFILDRSRLEAKARRTASSAAPSPRLAYKGIPRLVMLGWLLLIIGAMLVVVISVTSGSALVFRQSAWIVLSIAIACFAVDFWLYRKGLNERLRYQVHRLTELSKASRLSEFDLHTHQDQTAEIDCNPLEDKRKADEIARRLDNYKTAGKRGLNVGCGGDLHQLVSKPYFDRGYDMVGVDISEGYLLQYQKRFGADAVLANALALPFAQGTFNVVHYCDVLEHMHHPFLGLSEVNRVLKNGGLLILSTNYRCRLSRECANPLILLERFVSLYYDAVLGPRDMLRGFGDMEFYHLEFSKRELTDLFESAGFEVTEFYTYLYKRKSLTNLFSRLPILRFMGDTILVTCKKNFDLPRQPAIDN